MISQVPQTVELTEAPAKKQIERSVPSGLTLRPYQEAAVSAVLEAKEDVWRRLLVLATGGGKTVIAAAILDRVLKAGQRALFLAHREELLTQAKAEIEGFVPDLHVEIEQAENRAAQTGSPFDEKRRHVVVGSVQTMQRKRLESWARNAFSIVVIDEAHHGAAKSYQNIVEHFGCLDEEQKTPLVGITATPMRSDKVGLDVIFQEIAFNHGIREMIEDGHLCDVRAISVRTETDLRGIKTIAGDYAQGELENATDNAERNALIIAAHRKYALDRPTIVFATGVEHARHLAELFRASGVSAEAMYGAMEDEERKGALGRYASGETQVLTNYALLTEGFNAPATSCIILGRPTKSNLVITQAIGRGTRLHPGKADCLVIDVLDIVSGKNLFSAASLAGLPANFDLKGKSMFTAAKKYAELQKVAPALAEKSLTPEAVEENLKATMEAIRARELDILQREEQLAQRYAPVESAKYRSPFQWQRIDAHRFEISPDGETKYAVACRQEDNPAKWLVASRHLDNPWNIIGSKFPDVWAAVRVADLFIAERHNTSLIQRDAPWTAQPATSAQIALLTSLLERYNEQVPANLSKGEADRRIRFLRESNPLPARRFTPERPTFRPRKVTYRR